MVRTSFFSGFGKNNKYWKKGTKLEVFKFSLYLFIPVMTSVFYANPDFMHKLIMYLGLVQYPEERTLPSPEEIEKLRELEKRPRP